MEVSKQASKSGNDSEEAGPSQRKSRFFPEVRSDGGGNQVTQRREAQEKYRVDEKVEIWRRLANWRTNPTSGERCQFAARRDFDARNWTHKNNYENASAGNANLNPHYTPKRLQGNVYDNNKKCPKIESLRSRSNENTENNRSKADIHDSSKESASPREDRHRRYIGFKFLAEVAESNSNQVFVALNKRRDAFKYLLQSHIERPDLFVLILKIVATGCASPFDQMKYILLLDICNTQFIINLRNYLMDLPDNEGPQNELYWKNPIEFWQNFITICESIIKTIPSVAINKCRLLIQDVSKFCLEGLSKRHGFNLPQEQNLQLERLRDSLTIIYEQQRKNIQGNSADQHGQTAKCSQSGLPPDNFRDLSVLPTCEDLLERRPYLRPNIVNGAYVDIEHYLDVQFRLLREDCYGPLRDGIHQFLEEPRKKKFDNIRVHHNVTFVQPYTSKQKIGAVVQLDKNDAKRFKDINWAHSKRLIFGSLLIFTKDNCKTFIVATILERDILYLRKGQILISFVDDTINVTKDLYTTKETYIMIESEVYFEPYYHILKAFQHPMFPAHIAMSKYIVKVDPEPNHPSYLKEDSVYSIETKDNSKCQLTVLNDNTWPTSQEMGFDESQYEAYRLALAHEFAVIQGPPGTGKTYLGVKIAQTLLQNNIRGNGCLLLLICYTNHALDQFLEALTPITESIARIGGQSRNEAMEKFNLNKIRRQVSLHHLKSRSIFHEHRLELKEAMGAFRHIQELMDVIENGIISYYCITKHIPDIQSFINKNYSRTNMDPILYWLFENMPRYFDDSLLHEYKNRGPRRTSDDDINKRNNVCLDEFDEEDSSETSYLSNSFSVSKAEAMIQSLVTSYHDKGTKYKDKQDIIEHLTMLSSQIKFFEEMSVLRGRKLNVNNKHKHPSQYSTQERWIIYFGWADRVLERVKGEIMPLQQKLQEANTAYEESRMMMDSEIMRDIEVVGMTTSGAARLRKLLQALKPAVVIVEEAAEVLEQHIVASLTKHCQHLILIGDHQQLRPSAAHARLAKHYNLEVSLFERMIVNKMHSRRLCVQHRMRPEIAALISPLIYPDLENHPLVRSFPDVLGMNNNLFFFTHDFLEEAVDDSASKANHQEADMVLSVANYLMQQGYEPGDITVLAAYSGQMFYMRKQREKYTHLGNVKITVVDNYQGEESRIILLSLVRNNREGKIGFLKIENRVCVALSRAKEGLYIFGNIDILGNNSELWVKVAETLKKNNSLGTVITLRCQNHPNQLTTISSTIDFEKVPEGGCTLACETYLPSCGHQCPLICHGYDRRHKDVKCIKKCERLCEAKLHECPLLCGDVCRCEVSVLKELPCGHSKEVPCHLETSDPGVKCSVIVPFILPGCGHETEKQCHLKSVPCPIKCDTRLPCGHVCELNCHVTSDPDHEHYVCRKPCAKAKKACSLDLEEDRGFHQCQKLCYEDCDDCEIKIEKKRSNCKHTEFVACNKNVDETTCRKNCARTMSCGHFCKKKCYEKCFCQTKVMKEIPECGHSASIECGLPATRELCGEPCARTLPCGHACRARCNQPCGRTSCQAPAPDELTAPCGHRVRLPCHAHAAALAGTLSEAAFLQHCSSPCGALLACGHACGGSCGGCRQGRLHAPCAQVCNQTLICGHRCTEPCSSVCPPCNKPCEVRCRHSKCKKRCGEPCVFCQEACTRRCAHGACTRRCGAACARGACGEACPRALPCGHRCRGLCGEPCPPACALCRPDHFPKDFLGDPFEEDDKFVLLEDCNHILEVKDMDNLMFGDKETIAMRACPFCRKPIINTHRYKDFVNNMFKKEINPIKERVYGTKIQITKRISILRAKVVEYLKSRKFFGDKKWQLAFNQVKFFTTSKQKVSLLQVEMQFIRLNILEMLSDTFKAMIAAKIEHFKEEVIYQLDMVTTTLISSAHKISQQQQEDIGNEIKRANSLIQLDILQQKAIGCLVDPKVNEVFKKAKSVIISWTAYDETKGVEALKALQDAINVSGIAKEYERKMIVKAIGLKAGHWYKCPNGHFYCIGECGGAMEKSKCIECGVAIGGTSHNLLSGNLHAPEMDGSRFAAWSEEYNNMANFNLD